MLKQKRKLILGIIKSHAVKVGIVVAVLVATIFIVAYSFWPRTFMFAYQQQTCISKITLLPDSLQFKSEDFSMEETDMFKVAGVNILSRAMCVSPVKTPTQGTHTVGWSLFGRLPIGYSRVDVPSHPTASVSLNKPLPVTQPLKLQLSAADEIFDYKIHADKNSTECYSKGAKLDCQFQDLKLSQGTGYKLSLVRYFEGKKVATIAEQKIKTLTATTVKASSIKPGEVIFNKPKTMSVIFDKSIANAEVKLVDTKANKEVKLVKKVSGKTLELNWKEDLKRLIDYKLTISKVEAKDGSSLVEPYVSGFKTSGGPKVSQVSIGSSKVPLGSTAIVTFDQSLAEKQDLAKIVTVTGGAKVAGAEDNKLYISLAGAPKCGEVTIKINSKLQSIHNVSGGSDWSYKSRMICYDVETIGYSVQGRPIDAYIFGGGAHSIVYTGAIHGSESSTYSLMLRWIDELDVNAPSIPPGRTAIVIPSINPDGLARGSRTNSNNVDLNRNFATADWSKDITTVNNAPFPGGGGVKAMSEPETRAIASYIARVSPRLVLSYHSIGALLESNLAGNASSAAQNYANLSGYRNATGSAGTFEYSYSGTADDYYGQILGVPSVLIELGSHSYHQFEQNQKAMWAALSQ
jgi:predicted deacylase